jgi:hypothetical protein
LFHQFDEAFYSLTLPLRREATTRYQRRDRRWDAKERAS